ncbi:MAG: polysaccharide deacetylase family protein [Candidatus Subteraquimicrobiales bacterium]|nr:polysaccharide deacetylase family protein [Candidatus Subteraquimicrobiales bacterium]
MRKGPPAVAITFDDGFQNNHDIALPILRDFNLPATIFLNTAFVGTDDWHWYCRVHSAVSTTQKTEFTWRGERFAFNSIAAKAAASSRLRELLKNQTHQSLLSEMTALVSDLGSDPQSHVPSNSVYRILDHNSIAKCLDSRLISFGAHTRHHTILSKLSNLEQKSEIVDSIRDVEQLTGQPCSSFAYPNGGSQDYNDASLTIIKETNIEVAVTTQPSANSPTSDPFQLGRYGIGCGTAPAFFQKQVHHLAT